MSVGLLLVGLSVGLSVDLSAGYSFGPLVILCVVRSVVWSVGQSVQSGQVWPVYSLHQMLVKYLPIAQVLLFPRSQRKGLESVFYGGEALG